MTAEARDPQGESIPACAGCVRLAGERDQAKGELEVCEMANQELQAEGVRLHEALARVRAQLNANCLLRDASLQIENTRLRSRVDPGGAEMPAEVDFTGGQRGKYYDKIGASPTTANPLYPEPLARQAAALARLRGALASPRAAE